MKLDPKYFNLFLSVCAIVTVAVILYGTLRYIQHQEEVMRDNVEQFNWENLSLLHISTSDSLQLSTLRGSPVVIDFWSTWSDKSYEVHEQLDELKTEYPDLMILAGAVRDSDDLIEDYIRRYNYSFVFVYGTDFYNELGVPGVPSQIMIDRYGHFFELQIGQDEDALNRKIHELMENE